MTRSQTPFGPLGKISWVRPRDPAASHGKDERRFADRSAKGCLGSAVAGLGALVGALACCLPAASAGQPGGSEAEALQVLADVVLIESQCRTLAVDYGRLFDFAERNGISPMAIMPTGERRAAFEADYGRRAREMRPDRLCGDLAAARAIAIPGVFTAR